MLMRQKSVLVNHAVKSLLAASNALGHQFMCNAMKMYFVMKSKCVHVRCCHGHSNIYRDNVQVILQADFLTEPDNPDRAGAWMMEN